MGVKGVGFTSGPGLTMNRCDRCKKYQAVCRIDWRGSVRGDFCPVCVADELRSVREEAELDRGIAPIPESPKPVSLGPCLSCLETEAKVTVPTGNLCVACAMEASGDGDSRA